MNSSSDFNTTRSSNANARETALYDSLCKKDRTEDAFKTLSHLKATKWKGEIILMLDGSGNVAKVKKSEYI